MIKRFIFKRLDRMYVQAKRLTVYPDAKIVFFSDEHMGDGSKADDFAPNRDLFYTVIENYQDWLRINVGDAYELGQFTLSHIADTYPIHFANLYLIGNHDSEMRFTQALVIDVTPPIFAIHGHQAGDFWNYELWPLCRFFIRYVWRPLEYLGLKDPQSSKTSVRHDYSRRLLKKWANSRGIRVVAGHTHYQEQDEMYYNCGTSAVKGKVECIEYTPKSNALMLRRHQ